ncbi:MAG: hypothetical protein H6621_08595 [Halobacteriovoraceae bacterium]|nr:hypothetical protein [Halobacteriovoraceae bacterium]MCB9095111.1 hypothetical protein [Halobacteriovoraceae bacterium]
MKKIDIKAKVEQIKKTDKQWYEALRNHDSKIVTRRDFVAHGLMGATSFLFAPSLINGMLSNNAFAQANPACSTGGGGGSSIPFMVFNGTGGGTYTKCFAPRAKDGGEFLNADALSIHGIGPTANPTTNPGVLDMSAGAPMITTSGLYRGLAQALGDNMGKMFACTIPNRSENDGTNSNNSPAAVIGAIRGGDQAAYIGDANSALNIGSGIPTVVAMNDADAARNLADTGLLGEALGGNNDNIGKFFDSIKSLSDSHLRSFASHQISDPLKQIIGCGYQNAKESILSITPDGLDPRGKAEIDGPFGGDNGSKLAAMSWLVAKGFAGSGMYNMNGYDYHGRGAAAIDAKDVEMGQSVGRYLATCLALGKPGIAVILGDGGAAAKRGDTAEDANGMLAARSDSSDVCSVNIIGVTPGEKPEFIKTQIGTYRDSGQSDAASLTSVPLNAMIAVVITYLGLLDRLGEAPAILGKYGLSAPDAIDNLRAFGPLKGI